MSKHTGSRVKLYENRDRRPSQDSNNRNFLSFTMGKPTAQNQDDSRTLLRNSTELFNRKKSKRNNLLKNRNLYVSRNSKDEGSNLESSEGLEKKLGRFKSLKNLVNQAKTKEFH